jgi:hypothetical protein
MIKLQAPYGRKHRVSSDSAWPLRNSEGLTFAEAKRRRELLNLSNPKRPSPKRI